MRIARAPRHPVALFGSSQFKGSTIKASTRLPSLDTICRHSAMTRYRRLLLAVLILAVGFAAASVRLRVRAADEHLAARLGDGEFWHLTEEFSEPNGYFRSDNLLSNEVYFQYVVKELIQRTEPGGVYLGVGPEQNFTYIAALKPKIAFIPDIRRGNLHLHLMYKALFELSADRADFVSRLFTRKRPARLTSKSTAEEIFTAYGSLDASAEDVYNANLKGIEDLLTKKHGLPLSNEDLSGINYVYRNFYSFGPSINYNSSTRGGGFGGFVSYADLMAATDANNVSWSYLANEENFRIVKDLEQKNLIVPLVGDFAGPKAIRAVGKFLKEHNATVTAFYVSNVEQFLYGSGTWTTFCRNVTSLPLDAMSTFIRSTRSGGFGRGAMSVLGSMRSETESCSGTSR
jgi:hypothetical protein